jgi:ABC-type transport system involved in cytochrome bd biosynthesis fused ATPase/permease subunit
MVIATVVTAIWATGYLLAFFVDRSLEALAQSVTPVLLIVVGFLFTRETIDLLKGRRG